MTNLWAAMKEREPPVQDHDWFHLFEDMRWSYGAEREFRVLRTGMYVALARNDGEGGDILIEFDRAIFQRNKDALFARATEIWPDVAPAEALQRLLITYLSEAVDTAEEEPVRLRFSGDGFAPMLGH